LPAGAAFDRYVGPRDGALPWQAREVLLTPPKDLRVPVSGLSTVSPDPWRKAGEALKGDPATTVPMDDVLPALPNRPPPTLTILPRTTVMTPLRVFLPVPRDPEAAPRQDDGDPHLVAEEPPAMA
jgi:hypothetical protein